MPVFISVYVVDYACERGAFSRRTGPCYEHYPGVRHGYLFKDLSNSQDSPGVLTDKVSKGELGTKTGKGFYEYEEGQVEKLIESRDRRPLKIFGLQQQD